MNTLTKQLIGASIGGILGYFVGDVVVEYLRAKEDLENVFCNNNNNERPEQLEEEITMERVQVKKGKRTNHSQKNYTEFFASQGRPDLAMLASKYSGVNEDLPEEEDEEALINSDIVEDISMELGETWDEDDEFDPIEENKDPSIISLEEYNNDEEFTKVILLYYEDDVLTTDKNKPIQRPEKFLGDDALVSFGGLSGDENKVYIRNSHKGAMYEIVRLNKNYGISDSVRRDVRRHSEELKEEENGEEANT
jgi:hypothetical protein